MGSWFVTGAIIPAGVAADAVCICKHSAGKAGKKGGEAVFCQAGPADWSDAATAPDDYRDCGQIGSAEQRRIFSIEDAFDRGAEKIIEQNLAKGRVREEIVQLKAELAGLREKLGFKNKVSEAAVEKNGETESADRQQADFGGQGCASYPQDEPGDGGIETAIIENNENEIRVKLTDNIKINFGDLWRLRYSYGASVWEFESSVIGYDGNILRLSHSDNVRFISRRRF